MSEYLPVESFREDILYDRSSYPIREPTSEKGSWTNPLEINDFYLWKNTVDNKLYKKETMPENENDGTIVNI